MPLEVLIATPSGPFGELIRLTLEADPAFRCTIIDKGEEFRAVIQTSSCQAVIFDCSYSQPGADEVAQFIRAGFPSMALFFIPADNQPDLAYLHNIQADGIISRPFDASFLPELIQNAVKKRNAQFAAFGLSHAAVTSQTWMNALQKEIRGTSASNGLIIQHGLVVAATLDIRPQFQEQAVSDILRYWNPSDTSDLIRYIKDPETNQEWMMYATEITGSEVLALLFQPQTPVTKVRIQTVQLARKLNTNPALNAPVFQDDEEGAEVHEPPKLQEILSETAEEETKNDSTSFPVEWFKETDFPDTAGRRKNHEYRPESAIPSSQIKVEENKEEIPYSDQIVKTQQEYQKKGKVDTEDSLDLPEFESETHKEEFSINLSESLPSGFDLGSFQPVDLIAETPAAAGLDSLQPVALKSDPSPAIPADIDLQKDSKAPGTANSIEISDEIKPQFTEMVPSNESRENVEQLLDETLPDPEPGISEINGESEIPFSEKFGLTKGIPEDLTDTPDFENIPYFLSSSSNETQDGERAGITAGDIEDVLSPSGLTDFQPGGEPAMENFRSDNEQDNVQPGQKRIDPHETNETRVPSETNDGDLFSRMNQLQSSVENDRTETITVALIPRRESFILQRQIAGVLNQSMDRLCQAFGWKLENLTIRPTYLQWTVTIPNMFTPDDIVAIVRQQTTQALFENIADLQPLADGEDIWAPESMIMTGIDFVPSTHWQNFILRRKNSEIA